MSNVSQIAKKELSGFFSSLTGLIFFGAFLISTLFVFFWVETFFARNIADVRPLFEWMPILLVFLVPALTMKMWSEERSSGTIELLLTSRVSNLELVLGKFLACLGLVSLAVALTLPLAFTVSMLGPLDWGPVVGGYVAAVFLAGAYSAIGLYVSAKTTNQIVSLLISVLVCGVFYLIGSSAILGFFDNQIGEILSLCGSGSRFNSITRGIIDFRDIYYYLSIIGVFLSLNVLALERMRWAGNPSNPKHKEWLMVAALFITNFVLCNFWIERVSFARVDLTAGQIYSISDTTKKYLSRLKEPLLIRGYFSAKTHPLLAPLVPRLRDILQEYELAGNGKVKVEFVDPLKDPELEKEAGEKYGVRAKPFQTSDKYQASVANSYFDILIKYGDQFETLSYADLIDVKASNESEIEVDLRNPEYDITSTIKKVLYAYQGSGNVFDNLTKGVKFVGYISNDQSMPQPLVALKNSLISVLAELKKKSNGKFSFELKDPASDGGALAVQIEKEYGFKPMAIGLLDTKRFWFYMTLKNDDQTVQIPLPEDLSKGGLERSITSGLKRYAKGFLKTIGLVTPPIKPPMPQYGMPAQGKHFMLLRKKLSEQFSVKPINLVGGIPEDIDLLLIVSPKALDEKKVFAVDQFLMQGGTVILSSSPFDIDMQKALSCHKLNSGLSDWLKHNGIEFEDTIVLDNQNAAFPIPIKRNISGFEVIETQMAPYPYFVDVRGKGLDKESGLIAGLNQVTLNWASPIKVKSKKEKDKNSSRKQTILLRSSDDSWTSESLNIQPDYQEYEKLGFKEGKPEDKKSHVLAIATEGKFDSYFKGKESPLKQTDANADKQKADIVNVIEKSTDSARIILYSSNTFLSDEMLELASAGMGTRYLNPVDLIQNSIDWSLDDRDLLSIRGRAQFSRTLKPLTEDDQRFWEYLNYVLAAIGLGSVVLLRQYSRNTSKARYKAIFGDSAA